MSYRSRLAAMVSGKNIHILGLGTQGGGVGTANTLAQCGAHVTVWDEKSAAHLQAASAQLSPHIRGHYGTPLRGPELLAADMIIKNPAVPFDHPALRPALAAGIPVTTETALALTFCRDKTIGITGTRGKTTTTHLIHHILAQAGYRAHLGGNIPQKPTLAIVADAADNDWLVVEISSFHLEAMQRAPISPHLAVLTSISPDHLNRYASYPAYQQTKLAIFQHQQPGDHAFWLANPDTAAWSQHLPTQLPDQVHKHPLSAAAVRQVLKPYPHHLPGTHNDENVALAVTVAQTLSINPDQIRSAVATFAGVPYRLQEVAHDQGIKWINDTTATTPVALEKALTAWPAPAVFIIGGTSKQLPFADSLLQQLRRRQHQVVWLSGSGTQELLEELEIPSHSVTLHNTFTTAGRAAWQLAQQHGAPAIVLSPGFSSFEHFRHEFDRGDQFNHIVTTRQYL